jgi:FkbM family methyltransferase
LPKIVATAGHTERGRAMSTSTMNDVVATYHGVEVLDAPHLGPTMINNMIEGTYERREVLSALKFVKKDDVVIEMGAGAGVVGAVAAKNCAPARIVSFEANHKLIASIKALYAHNGIKSKIEVRNKIVLSDPDAPKSVDFYIRGNFLGSGMTITKGMERAEKVDVPVVKWETIKKQIKPTVLLMDIEGAELEFFRYADLSGIRVIIVELHRHIYHRPGMREIRDGIAAKGFVEDTDASGRGVFVFTAV